LLISLHLPLPLFLLVGSGRLGLVLPGSFHFILSGFGLRVMLPIRWWLLLLRFCLPRFFFLLFFVLCVETSRARNQSRENS
jgi:hypothetical protein